MLTYYHCKSTKIGVKFLYFHIRKEDSIFLYYFIQTDNFNKNGRDINILSRETVEPGPCTCGSLDLEKLDICIFPFCLGPSLTSLYFPEKKPILFTY